MRTETDTVQYAGLWRRLVAFAIDLFVVGLVVSTLILSLAIVFPKLSSLLVLDSPYAVLTAERTINGKATNITAAPGAPPSGDIVKTVERTIWGRWTYRYRVTEVATEKSDPHGPVRMNSDWQRIDPATGDEIEGFGVVELVWLTLLLFYWPFMEVSRLQASLGKWAVAIKVTNAQGMRVSLQQALARNLLKIASALPLLIGYLIIPFMKRKQGLHDMMARCVLPLSV